MKKYLNIILLIVFLSTTCFAQNNLLVNPGFEENTDTVSGWWINAWGGASGYVETETGNNVIAGNVSAKVIVETVGDKVAKVNLMSDPVTNVPEGELIVTVFARTLKTDNVPFKISLKCKSADGTKKWYNGQELNLLSTAEKYSYSVNPEAAYRDSIWVRLSCGKNLGTYIFDDVFFGSKNNFLPIPKGRRLREIVADKYPDGNVYIGGTTQGPFLGTFSEDILNNEFSYITPANDFKQSYIHPEPGIYRWKDANTWIQKAKINGQVIRMHSPIGPQCSKWAKDDSRTASELLQNLEEYVTELCRYYNGEENILWMDVVNETIDKKTGEWFGPKPGTDKWENPWTIIGFDTTDDGLNPPIYIDKAFELANKYAPNIKQIINQHGTMNDAVWDKVKALVYYLRGKGRRVDGIGFQCHVDVGWEKENNDSGVNNIVALGNLIDWAHENNLEFHITENNVYLRNGNEGKYDEQADTYKAIVKTLLSKRNTGVVTWNTWMLRDGNGQTGDRNPCLFRQDGSAKPAYYAVQKVLENTVTTDVFTKKKISDKFILYNNYPNPFNPTTTIEYSIPEITHPHQKNGAQAYRFASSPFERGLMHTQQVLGGGVVIDLKVYDVLGKEVATLVNKKQKPGNYKIMFDASALASGIYYYQLKSGKFIKTKNMLLLK